MSIGTIKLTELPSHAELGGPFAMVCRLPHSCVPLSRPWYQRPGPCGTKLKQSCPKGVLQKDDRLPKKHIVLFAVGEYMSSGISTVANAFFGWVTREEKRRWMEAESRGT